MSFTSPNPKIDFATSFIGIATWPKLIFSKKTTTKPISKAENKILCCAFFFNFIVVVQRNIVDN